MSHSNDQKNHARQLLGMTLAVAMLTSLVTITSYSGTRSRSFSVAKTNGTTTALTQPQTTALKANGKIAFARNIGDNYEIFTMNPDGSEVRQLTANPGLDYWPKWSPDGTKLAFYSGREKSGTFVMNADGSNQRLLIDSEGWGGVTWSPDGRKLAFSCGGICTINIDGSNQTNLTNNLGDYAPAWSPDGSMIAFTSSRDGVIGIYVMNVDGSNQTRLTNSYYDYGPAWSPDGTRIAFTRYGHCIDFGDGDLICFEASIVMMNPDGSRQSFLTGGSVSSNADADLPAWSPDGARIAFQGYRTGSSYAEIFVINASGGSRTNLSNTPDAHELVPDWAPVPPPSAPCINPIDCAESFVRQQYLDFLNREPDAGGLAYWTDQIAQCGTDARCIHERRIGVSAAFFIEQEFQDTGYYVDRFYKASFGRQPNYAEFTADRSKVTGGSSLEANKQAFADEWVQRQAFRDAYPITMSNTEVVNKLFDSAGLTTSTYDPQRQQEIAAMNAGHSRALVLRDVIEIPDFKNIPDPNDPRYNEVKQTSQYNSAFVLMQYFGYLHRDVDQSGYDFWLDVLNNREPNNYRGMVCSFLTSSEYQLRFGSMVTRTNADCAQ
jgi:hypothetical protein